MGKDQIQVSKEDILTIQKELKEIQGMTEEGAVVRKLDEILDFIEHEVLTATEKLALEERIYNKMIEVKANDKQLNASLYILYKNLQNNRIPVEQAEEMFEGYLRIDQFNRLI